MELIPMSLPESLSPFNKIFGGQVVPDPAIDRLVPKTNIDHLLSEKARQQAEQERKEFEAVGRDMRRRGHLAAGR
jgi:hypothetical protein